MMHRSAERAATAARHLARPFRNCHGRVTTFAAALLLGAGALHAQGRLPAPAKDSTRIAYDDDGLRIHSADGTRQFKVRLLLDLDGRFVLSDTNDAITNSIGVRRGRVYFDGNINKWMAFRMSLDVVTPNVPPINDAFLDVSFSPTWWLRVGRQKSNFGWERVISITDQPLPERSIIASLMPNRDMGALLNGEFDHNRYSVSLGLFNGVPDGANGDVDANDAKDLTFRALYRPMNDPNIHRGVGIGVEATRGVEGTTGTTTQLPHLVERNTQTWFAYREGTGATVAAGTHTRTGVFAYAHVGQWGANAELLHNTQAVKRGTSSGDIDMDGFLASGDIVLTGEPSTEAGIAPSHEFDPSKGHWGAWQVVARLADIKVDDGAFPVFADPALAAHHATELGLGLNWYMTRQTKVQASFETTSFKGGAPNGGDRKTENTALLRLQLYF